LELRNITKTFPGVVANNNVSLSFNRGEIHCLLGENGAGKTTLMNIIFGLYQPDHGEILLNGQKIDISNPSKAIQAGIGMVHQHFMLVNPMTVAENVVLGHEPPSKLVFPMRKAVEDVCSLSQQYGLEVDPTANIEDIPLGIRQRVEIIKALYRKADILILDEPTAVLSPPEINELYKVISALSASDKTVIFITHKLKETMAISDRVTVLRDGQVIGTVHRQDTSPDMLARMMVGREVVLRVKKEDSPPGETIFEVRNLHVEDARHLPAVNGVDIDVKAGQIYGIAGIEGNGQSELVEAIMGLRRIRQGEVLLEGVSITALHPSEILASGVGHVPEDRLQRGLVEPFNIAENLILGYHRQSRFEKFNILQKEQIAANARKLVEHYDIRTPTIYTSAGSLSGGNQQKIVLARALSTQPKVLLVSQPTRGLDVGAIEYVHHLLLEMRRTGAAILLISADLDEIRSLSDRIGVLYQGKIVAEKFAKDFTEEELGLFMAGEKGIS
jgi:general nucleoside transport system ATP-binding protein